MYFVALATDYDGTLAEDGRVAPSTLAALKTLKESGRRLILVSGRELPDLQRVFPDLDLFDVAVLENGALLYLPETGEEVAIADPPPPIFVDRLRQRNVAPLSVGRSIVATWTPHEAVVLETIRELGLELQIIFNKGAVMVLPAGVNKASGLAAALARLRLSPLNVVGIGDAENDHAFLRACGCAVAVANALEMVKADADIVTDAARGAGVAEIIARLVADDLADATRHIAGQRVALLQDADNEPIDIHPQGGGVLIAGTSGGGKSTITAGIIERIAAQGFQYCVIDPEGDYAGLAGAVTLGDIKAPAQPAAVAEVLDDPRQNAVVNLLGVELADRPRFLAALLPKLCHLRAQTGRPHWLVIDEAHHMLPPALGNVDVTLPRELAGSILVTVRPEHVAPQALQAIGLLIAVGAEADRAIRSFCEAVGETPPAIDEPPLERGEAMLWDRGARRLRRTRTLRPEAERLRHSRKYASGQLGEDKSFYFRGPDKSLNLRAQNLSLFLQIADGVDASTWLHHLRVGDYSRWIELTVKDRELATEIAAVEGDRSLSADESRALVREAIGRRYTGPA